MKYNLLGRTGLEVSAVGLGCEHLDGAEQNVVDSVIGAALEGGVNIMDVFMPGEDIRMKIAKSLGGKRKDVYIQGHIGSCDLNQQYDISRDLPTVKKYFEALLRHFGYIDLGMMFFIDSEEDYKGVFETGFADYVLSLKEKGDIRHIGFSSHNPKTAIKAINTGLPEMMMFSINPVFDMFPSDRYVLAEMGDGGIDISSFTQLDPIRAELYKLCESKQIGITVMKTLGAGKFLSAEHTPFDKPLTANQCIHYALTRPAVASVLLGAKSPDEIKLDMEYFNATDEEKDYTKAIASMKDFRGSCVYCSHCQPCPSEIDIAAVNKYLDIALLDELNVPPSVKSHYDSLAHHGSECVSCGSCEGRCPFNVSIIENMQKAEEVFGK